MSEWQTLERFKSSTVLGGGGAGCPAGAGADRVDWVACCVSPWEKFGNVIRYKSKPTTKKEGYGGKDDESSIDSLGAGVVGKAPGQGCR